MIQLCTILQVSPISCTLLPVDLFECWIGSFVILRGSGPVLLSNPITSSIIDAQAGLHLCCSQPPKTGFLASRPNYNIKFTYNYYINWKNWKFLKHAANIKTECSIDFRNFIQAVNWRIFYFSNERFVHAPCADPEVECNTCATPMHVQSRFSSNMADI